MLLPVTIARGNIPPGSRCITPADGNLEYIVSGTMMTQDEALGRVPNTHTRYEISKLLDGKLVSHTESTLDEKGFRLSSASGLPGKSKHLILLDSSTIFGDGLLNDETIAYQLNKRSKTYEIYAAAYSGFGLQHSWVRFKEGILKKQVLYPRGSAALLLNDGADGRIFGAPHLLHVVANFPYVAEKPEGGFENRGTFAENGKWWQRALVHYCVPITVCLKLVRMAPFDTTEERMAFEGRMIDEIERMYRSQFQAEDFWVLWQGTQQSVQQIRRYTKAKVLLLPLIDLADAHPTPLGARQIADYLFKKKVLE